MDDNEVGPAETESGLADVTRMALPKLLSSDDSALTNALYRLLADMDQAGEIIAGFNSFVASKRDATADSADDAEPT